MELKQSTARNIMVFMNDATDHITGKIGLTLTITASKNGGAFNAITPTVTERGSGWYSLALTTSHTDTLGDFCLHVTATDADPSDIRRHVVANLTADVKTDTASLETKLTTARAGYLDNLAAGAVALDSTAAKDATVAKAAALATTDGKVDAIKAKTDNLPASPAATGDQMDLVNAPNATGLAALAAAVWAYATRTLTASALTAADVWSYATRALTDKLGFELAASYDDAKTAAQAADLATVDGKINIIGSTMALDATAAKAADLATAQTAIDKIFAAEYGRLVIDTTLKTMTQYAMDGVTIIKVHDLTTSLTGLQPVIERVPR